MLEYWFYFAEWKVGNLKYYAVSLSPIKGKQCVYIPAGGLSALGGGVMDRTNNILCSVVSDAAQYRGGNNDASRDGTYRTQLGMVATNMQYRNFQLMPASVARVGMPTGTWLRRWLKFFS